MEQERQKEAGKRKGLTKSCGMVRRKKWAQESVEERCLGEGIERARWSKEGGRGR